MKSISYFLLFILSPTFITAMDKQLSPVCEQVIFELLEDSQQPEHFSEIFFTIPAAAPKNPLLPSPYDKLNESTNEANYEDSSLLEPHFFQHITHTPTCPPLPLPLPLPLSQPISHVPTPLQLPVLYQNKDFAPPSRGITKKRCLESFDAHPRQASTTMYPCPECGNACLREYTNLINHMLCVHIKPECTYPGCSYRFHDFASVKLHKSRAHKDASNSYVIEAQKKISKNLNPLLEKLGWNISCTLCKILFPQFDTLSRHLRTHGLKRKEITQLIKKAQNPGLFFASDYLIPKSSPQPIDSNLDEALSLLDSQLAALVAAKSTQSVTPDAPKSLVLAASKASYEPFCLGCNKHFVSIDSLKDHILSEHARTAPYECEQSLCTFRTPIKGTYIYHMKASHRSKTRPSLQIQKRVSKILNPYLSAWIIKCERCDCFISNLPFFSHPQRLLGSQIRKIMRLTTFLIFLLHASLEIAMEIPPTRADIPDIDELLPKLPVDGIYLEQRSSGRTNYTQGASHSLKRKIAPQDIKLPPQHPFGQNYLFKL